MPPVSPYWFLVQPAATILAACIVLLGVVVTLRSNAKRLRNEQLEKRAKDCESRLQAVYAEYGAAAFLYFTYVRRIHQGADSLTATEMLIHEDQHRVEAGRERKFPEGELEDMLKEAMDLNAEAQKERHDQEVRVCAAYSKVLISDRDKGRLTDLQSMHDSLFLKEWWSNTDGMERYEVWERKEAYFRQFFERVSFSLEAQYRMERSMAERGMAPSLTVQEEAKEITW